MKIVNEVKLVTPARYLIKDGVMAVTTGVMDYNEIKGFYSPAHRLTLSHNGIQYTFFPKEPIYIEAIELALKAVKSVKTTTTKPKATKKASKPTSKDK